MPAPIIGITSRTAPVPPANLMSVMVQQAYTDAILQDLIDCDYFLQHLEWMEVFDGGNEKFS